MKIVVQKFGGTSVSTHERRLACIQKIEECIKNGFSPVVVVSAIGRKGDSYSTDTLIEYTNSSNSNPDPRELDLILSCGELISSVVFCNTLKTCGHRGIALTGGQAGIITDDSFGNANILRVTTDNLIKHIKNGQIPIVTGFQGITENGDITTLGRGGSDVTATILGEALSAEYIEIYTDVDGIMSVDPKLVPKAKPIDKMFYNDAFRMAEYGAKVIHKKAVQIAMRSNIPLLIKNTLNNSQGTLISNTNSIIKNEDEAALITAIAHSNNKVIVNIDAEVTAIQLLFDALDEEGIEVFMLNLNQDRKSFLTNKASISLIVNILVDLKIPYKLIDNLSCITLIGRGLLGVPRIFSKISASLNKNNIPILQTSDSHGAISCVIESIYEKTAVSVLHGEFELS